MPKFSKCHGAWLHVFAGKFAREVIVSPTFSIIRFLIDTAKNGHTGLAADVIAPYFVANHPKAHGILIKLGVPRMHGCGEKIHAMMSGEEHE